MDIIRAEKICPTYAAVTPVAFGNSSEVTTWTLVIEEAGASQVIYIGGAFMGRSSLHCYCYGYQSFTA